MPLGPFPDTHWSLVFRAGGTQADRREALGELLKRYLPALKAHLVLGRRMDRDCANDLVQGFVTDKLVERNLLGQITGGKGKFRTFLLKALDRYAFDQIRRQNAQKRSPGLLRPLEEAQGQGKVVPDPFDIAWGREVVQEALRRMGQACLAAGRPDLWEIFDARLVGPMLRGDKPLSYGQLVQRYGFRTPTQASNVLITGKRMFVRILRDVLGEYARDEQEIDSEFRQLREILGRAGACA
jgi:RNA polymerase sigma-70 factor (ECF subfamily)